MHLGEVLYGDHQLSVRRYAALVRWLPPEAALWRSMDRNWSTENELQALTIELLDSCRRMYLQANSKKGTQLPAPITIPRPWEKEKESRAQSGTTLGEMIKMLKVPVRASRGEQ